MSNNYLSKESTGVQCYAPPVCEVLFVGTQRVICASGNESIQGTETVYDIDGTW